MFEETLVAHGIKRGVTFACRLLPAAVASIDYHIVFVSQPSAGVDEVFSKHMHGNVYHSTVSPTGKTPESVCLGTEREAWMTVVMIRSQCLVTAHCKPKPFCHRLYGQCPKFLNVSLFHIRSVVNSFFRIFPH